MKTRKINTVIVIRTVGMRVFLRSIHVFHVLCQNINSCQDELDLKPIGWKTQVHDTIKHKTPDHTFQKAYWDELGWWKILTEFRTIFHKILRIWRSEFSACEITVHYSWFHHLCWLVSMDCAGNIRFQLKKTFSILEQEARKLRPIHFAQCV